MLTNGDSFSAIVLYDIASNYGNIVKKSRDHPTHPADSSLCELHGGQFRLRQKSTVLHASY